MSTVASNASVSTSDMGMLFATQCIFHAVFVLSTAAAAGSDDSSESNDKWRAVAITMAVFLAIILVGLVLFALCGISLD